MKVRKYILLSEGWKNRKAQRTKNNFWAEAKGHGHEIEIPKDPSLAMVAVDEEMDYLLIDHKVAGQVRTMVSEAIIQGPMYGRGKLCINYEEGKRDPNVL